MTSFRDDGAATVEWVARYLERVPELPVLAQVEPGEIRSRLPASPPEEGEPFSAVLRDLDEILLPGITNWQHPRFFAFFATTSSEPGMLAELLAAALNQIAFLWRTAPASTELEALVLDWVAQLVGLPDGWHGHIEDTASTSTLAALVAARHVTGRNAVVCSEHAHSSVEKSARILGMELRKAPVDAEFRMRADGLELGDVAAVVATVGTTSTTSVDPVAAIGDACSDAGTWLHVDAAYAGGAMVCPELRWAFEGVERADSLVINAHKWLFTPMDCSLLWTSRPEDFRAAFSLVPEYLRTPDSEDALSLSEYGPALGRRFRSLKLWAVLRCLGRAGLQERIRGAIRLAELFEGWVRDEPGWELCAARPFSVVCFRRVGSDEENEALMHRVNATGEIYISHTRLEGRHVLRLAVGHERTTEDDVRRAWEVLRREADG
ncbi:MAG: aromatic-L-amino-acid/L-tryptophan decarboxylase [Thermoleophilaceae bacterium]|nr:aromatic-L-amino-acid/L-tryptophan decarboxylase [Thermoleophilaceae bacterium]